MQKLWNPESKYRKWLEIELVQSEVLSEEGVIPKDAYATIREKASFNVSAIDTIEKKVKHDVIAFLTDVSQRVGNEARYLHYGMTSSDLLDTSFALMLREAAQMILEGLDELQHVLKEKALLYKKVVCVGRTHGVHAEPTSFGLKFALWYAEMARNRERIQSAQAMISYGKFSGAVGNYAYLTPEIEEKICKKLGLKPDPISTQVIQRDRHAQFFSTLAIVAGSIEKIVLEIRHLQRTEVFEAEEPFAKGQKGSSSMPHKRNPILSENLTGLARLVRANAQAALENIALWHERDISHSSVERVIAPDSTTLVDFMIHRLTELLKDLVVYEDRMRENLDKSYGLIFSQRVLLTLTEKGVSREKAYEWVQKNAMLSWEEKTPFLEHMLKDSEVREVLSEDEIKGCFKVEHYLKYVDHIYQRVFNCSIQN